MALIKCIDCGKEISDRGTNCPHCGCPVECSIKETSVENVNTGTVCNKCKTALCEKAVYCCICGEKVVKQEELNSVWERRYYVDEFQQPTDEWYVSTKDFIIGTFSDSVSSNQKVSVNFLIDERNVAIMLYKWGSQQVKNIFENIEEYDITVLKSDGTKDCFYAKMAAHGDRIFIANPNAFKKFISNESDTFKVHIRLTSSPANRTETYLFEVNPFGFKDAFNENKMEAREFKLCLENVYESDGELDARFDTASVTSLMFGGIDMIIKVDPSQDIRNLIQIEIKDGFSVKSKEIPSDIVPIIMYILSEPETTFKALYRNSPFYFEHQSLYRDILKSDSNTEEICRQFNNGEVRNIWENTSIAFEEDAFCIFEWYPHLFRRKKARATVESVKQLSIELFNYIDMVLRTKC